MRNSYWILLLFTLFLPLSAARYAFLVGNNKGTGNLAELKYVKNDIRELGDVLYTNCNFPRENITELYNGSPGDLLLGLDNFAQHLTLKESDVFFFYYSGHANNKSLLMNGMELPLSELKKSLKNIASDVQIVVLDACQSGSFSRLKGGVIDKPFMFKHDDNIEGQVVLYSSSDNEFSQESDLFRHSIFTFHLLNGLKGCADKSGDKLVTLNEAYQYSYNQTVTSTLNSAGGIQHPGYLFDIKGKGDVVLSDMTNKNSGIILDRSIKGSIAILNGLNHIVADFTKEADRDVFIALAPGRYDVYTNSGIKTSKARVQVRGDATQFLQRGNFSESRAVPIYAKGGKRQKKLKIKLNVLFGAIIKDHTKLTDELYKVYGDLPAINGQFQNPFEKATYSMGGGVGVEFLNGIFIRNHYSFYAYKGYESYKGDHGIGGEVFSDAVEIEYSSDLSFVEIGLSAGYKFPKGFLKNFSIEAGLNFVSPALTTELEVTEYLFNNEQQYSDSDSELQLAPSVGVAYTKSIGSYFELELLTKYTADMGPTSKQYETKYRYDNNAFCSALSLNFILNGK